MRIFRINLSDLHYLCLYSYLLGIRGILGSNSLSPRTDISVGFISIYAILHSHVYFLPVGKYKVLQTVVDWNKYQ